MNEAYAVAIIAGVAIPAVVDLVTHSAAPTGLKSFLALALSTLAGVLPTVVWTDNAHWMQFVQAVAVAWFAAMAAHRSRIFGSELVQQKTRQVGVGKPS